MDAATNRGSKSILLTGQCPRVSTPLSSTISLLLGFLSQTAEVCQESFSKGDLGNRSSSQASRDMEGHIQLLHYTLLMRCYCHSHERGTGWGKKLGVVAPEMQVGSHCHSVSGDNNVHGREAVVLRHKTVQEAQQTRRGRADRVASAQYKTLLE